MTELGNFYLINKITQIVRKVGNYLILYIPLNDFLR